MGIVEWLSNAPPWFVPAMWVISVVLAIIGTYLAARSYWAPIANARRLEAKFGGGLYQPDEIRNATRYYIDPDCSNVDPTQEAEMSEIVVRKPLFEVVDGYLSKDLASRQMG